jgi:hypothetical protein
VPKNEKRGHEQIYCSVFCRQKAYKMRADEKNNEIRNILQSQSGSTSDNIIREKNYDIQRNRSHNDIPIIELLKENNKAEINALQYQLRYEHEQEKNEKLIKENEELKIKIAHLENQIDEEDDDDENQNDVLSGIMNSPHFPTLVNLAQQFLMPKTQNNAKTSA